MEGRLKSCTRLLNLYYLFHRCSKCSQCKYGELLQERKCVTTFTDFKAIGRSSICFYLISKLSIFEESFEFWEVPWSVHNHSQAGISLQFYKRTDCSTGVVKKHITLNRLRDRSQQNLTGSALLIWQQTSVVYQPVTHPSYGNIWPWFCYVIF